jgi:hypothetical protein
MRETRLDENVAAAFKECNELREENKRLSAAVEFACQQFEVITSGDGSGHTDLAVATRRVAGKAEFAPKVCECGPLRNITDGGHFPACTRCKRRLR